MERIERRDNNNLLNVFKKRNKEFQLVRWSGTADSPSHHYLDQMELSNSLYVAKCSYVHISIPKKINHLNAVGLSDCRIRVRQGCISGIELTRCSNVVIFIRGPCQTLQIDLCTNVEVRLADEEAASACKIVHASNKDIRVWVKERDLGLQSSLLGDQVISKIEKGSELVSIQTSAIKHETRGYLDLENF